MELTEEAAGLGEDQIIHGHVCHLNNLGILSMSKGNHQMLLNGGGARSYLSFRKDWLLDERE